MTPVSNPKSNPPKVDIYAIARSFLFTFLGNVSNFIFVASIFSSIAIAPIQFIWFIAYFFRFSYLLNDKERKCFNVMKKWLYDFICYYACTLKSFKLLKERKEAWTYLFDGIYKILFDSRFIY